MSVLVAVLFLVLTRAEIIERFRAVPLTQVDGMVQVFANCPADLRREFQMPIASFVSDICRRLYQSESMRPVKFKDPGIVIHIGDVVTNCSLVVVRTDERANGDPFTRIYLPAPRFADRDRTRLAAVQAFYRCVRGENIDEETAMSRLRAAYPELRIADEYAAIAAWREGRRGNADDEKYLRLQRSVLEPGAVRREDVLNFASRLFLYPQSYDRLFCGRYDCCSFREAVWLAKIDPTVRTSAFYKINELFVFGGGHGERMLEAAAAYVDFLRALVAYEKTERELEVMLDEADDKLKGVLE